MQTFLPYPDFERSAASLDGARLGKQRVETLQILRALVLPEYGWSNHPAVVMWRHRVPALVLYGLVCARAWTGRGHADSTYAQIVEFAPEVEDRSQDELAATGLLPSWLGDPHLHLSHRSRLLAKDPAYYGPRFPGVPRDLEYVWPGPDPAAAADPPPVGSPLWVVRPESAAGLGTCVEQGVVGLGVGSSITGDAAGRDLIDLQAGAGVKRPTKSLVALARFVEQIEIGDRVGVPVAAGSGLLVGTVTGGYRWVESAEHGVHHQRPVAFDEVRRRSEVDPPASLQDVRPLFRVHLRTPADRERSTHSDSRSA